jgi:2-polyprenyl-3-methyl-5-hydroxy-6-metoxy-1,4-benzoquinol methylase
MMTGSANGIVSNGCGIAPQSSLPDSASNTSAGPLSCLICGATGHRAIFKEFDVDVLQCKTCRHIFSSFQSDPYYAGFWGDEVLDEGQDYWKFARNAMYQDFIQKYLAGRAGRLLDMGCGLGFFVQSASRVNGWEAYGCEISPVAVRYARQKLGLANVFCGRLDEVGLPAHSFDIVTMWDVLDHIRYPDPLLQRCQTLLRDGGICVIRTPNVVVQLPRARIKKLLRGMSSELTYLQARHHLHHYSKSTIKKLLERNAFSAIEFTHLQPVSAPEGSPVRRGVKAMLFTAVRALAAVSRGHLNLDNLFVIAHT